MPFSDLEALYESLALAIDAVGEEKESLFLSKLCLLLFEATGDRKIAETAISAALADL